MSDTTLNSLSEPKQHTSFADRIKKDFHHFKGIYFMLIPVIAFYIIFCYVPMIGTVIAFKDYSPALGLLGSAWVGWENFQDFFGSIYFGRILINTLRISIASLIFGFPAPIIFALLINELKNKYFTKTVQTITYLPHFISLVVICCMPVFLRPSARLSTSRKTPTSS